MTSPLPEEMRGRVVAVLQKYDWNAESGSCIDALAELLVETDRKARFDEQLRTKISTVQRGEIVVHLPNEVISQGRRMASLSSSSEVSEINKCGWVLNAPNLPHFQIIFSGKHSEEWRSNIYDTANLPILIQSPTKESN